MNPSLQRIIACAGVAAFLWARMGATEQTRPLALENVRIVDGSGGPPVENGRIVIAGDRILRAGPSSTTAAPADAERVDLAGRTVIPGLIDSHFHIEKDPKLALRQLSHGVTAFRDPGQWDEAFAELRRMMAADGIAGPRIFTTGPHIDGEGPAYPADAVVARDAEEARRHAEESVRRGATALKIYYRLPFAAAKAVIDVCDARRIPCTAHLELLDARELIAAGLHGIEHITSFGISLLPRREAEAYRQAVLKDNDARRDGRYRIFAGADLDGPGARALYEVLRERKPFLDATLAVFERRPGPRGDAKPDLTPIYVAGFARMKQLTHRAAQAGARVVVGGHTEVPFAARGEAPWREMELLVESGFSPLDAISAATSTAAAFLYRDQEIGSLRAGFYADLVVLRGQPDRDVTAIRSVDRVMVAGRWIDTAKYRQY
ncbi:MAG TPA: amidohydrolase family protein [Vicinamibacterales bacterium]|nr:amidohydrolase family protein [Vicinamibacterales bacterium]